MERIASFSVDHEKMKRGIFVSRRDTFGTETITTFDLRMKEPNREPVLDMSALHTLEHLGATFVRNNAQWKNKIVYFGPMGCRTGFYLVLHGSFKSKDILTLIQELFSFVLNFSGAIPGASAKECGNYQEQNLDMAKYEAKKYLNEVILHAKDENLNYPV